jgi:L-iditol 2-dehydrogenase
MKAAYVTVPFQVEIRDIPVPDVGPEEVLIRVAACGICGTDLHFARDLAKEDPMPLGHEFVGVVEKTGSNSGEFSPGDSVIVENHTSCGVCAACKNGEPVYCTNLTVIMEQPCLAEFVLAPKRSLIRYDGLSAEEACLAEPLTVALDLVEEGGVPLGSNVAVFGPGTIGLMAAKLAKDKGARKVILTGRSHSRARLETGKKLGVDRIVQVDKENLAELVKQEAPEGLERIFITSPPKSIPGAFDIARFGAVIVFNGIDFDDPMITFDANAFHFKRLQLRATHSIPNLRFPLAIDLLRRKAINPDLFISHRFPFSDLPNAMKTAEEDKEHVVKAMITMDL